MRENNVVVNDILTRAEERIFGITGLKVSLLANEVGVDEEIEPTEKQAIRLISDACELWCVSRREIKQKNKTQPLPTLRQIGCLLLRNNFHTGLSDKFIASQLGYHEHSSVTHGVKSAQTFLKNNDEYFLRYYNKVKHLFNI